MKLRDYQQDIFEQIIASRSNDIVQLDTGAGKTPIEAALAQWAGHTLLIAHRNILIQQISEKLAAFGIEHDTISTEHTRRRCIAAHRAHGRSYIVRGHGTHRVASIQSIAAALRHHRFNIDTSLQWLIVIDEAHHVVPDNMWGQLRTLFPHARIVGFTATPARMDGESLHVSKGGLFDRLVQASTLGNDSARVLIESGYLSGFRAYMPVSSDPLGGGHLSRMRDDPEYSMMWEAINGHSSESVEQDRTTRRPRVAPLDWNSGDLQLCGDPVKEYMRLARGRPAILMAPAIKNAEAFAQQFRDARVPAACINSTQSQSDIARTLDAFRAGRVHVLTNVDMVGEGFDLPACEVLIIATRTASFPRYRQWCGRVLRPDACKEQAVIIDLTGMCAGHGLPDEPVQWDLLNPPCGPRERKHVPCDACGAYFLFKLENCPHCNWANAWQDRPSGFSPGSYEFDIKLLDQSLVSFVRRERQQAQHDLIMRTVLQRPPSFGGDLVGRTISSLVAWFMQRLLDCGVPIIAINAFTASSDAKNAAFWIKNFTAADARQADGAKAMKVYQQWLKSR